MGMEWRTQRTKFLSVKDVGEMKQLLIHGSPNKACASLVHFLEQTIGLKTQFQNNRADIFYQTFQLIMETLFFGSKNHPAWLDVCAQPLIQKLLKPEDGILFRAIFEKSASIKNESKFPVGRLPRKSRHFISKGRFDTLPGCFQQEMNIVRENCLILSMQNYYKCCFASYFVHSKPIKTRQKAQAAAMFGFGVKRRPTKEFYKIFMEQHLHYFLDFSSKSIDKYFLWYLCEFMLCENVPEINVYEAPSIVLLESIRILVQHLISYSANTVYPPSDELLGMRLFMYNFFSQAFKKYGESSPDTIPYVVKLWLIWLKPWTINKIETQSLKYCIYSNFPLYTELLQSFLRMAGELDYSAHANVDILFKALDTYKRDFYSCLRELEVQVDEELAGKYMNQPTFAAIFSYFGQQINNYRGPLNFARHQSNRVNLSCTTIYRRLHLAKITPKRSPHKRGTKNSPGFAFFSNSPSNRQSEAKEQERETKATIDRCQELIMDLFTDGKQNIDVSNVRPCTEYPREVKQPEYRRIQGDPHLMETGDYEWDLLVDWTLALNDIVEDKYNFHINFRPLADGRYYFNFLVWGTIFYMLWWVIKSTFT